MIAQHVVAVDPDGTSLQFIADPNGSVEVCGVDCGGKTIGGFVTGLDDFVFSLEFADGAHRAEDLFLHDFHVITDTGENCWLDEVAFVTMSLATSFNFSTGVLAGFDVGHDAVILQLTHLWPLEGVLLEWVTNDILGGSCLELLDELVINALLDVYS